MYRKKYSEKSLIQMKVKKSMDVTEKCVSYSLSHLFIYSSFIYIFTFFYCT